MKLKIKPFLYGVVALVVLHLLILFIGKSLPPIVDYLLYFISFSASVFFIANKFLNQELTIVQRIDGSIYFILIVFPLSLFSLMLNLRQADFSNITSGLVVSYVCIVCFSIYNLKFHKISNIILSIMKKV